MEAKLWILSLVLGVTFREYVKDIRKRTEFQMALAVTVTVLIIRDGDSRARASRVAPSKKRSNKLQSM